MEFNKFKRRAFKVNRSLLMQLAEVERSDEPIAEDVQYDEVFAEFGIS